MERRVLSCALTAVHIAPVSTWVNSVFSNSVLQFFIDVRMEGLCAEAPKPPKSRGRRVSTAFSSRRLMDSLISC